MTKQLDHTELLRKNQQLTQLLSSAKQNLVSFASILEDIKRAAHYQILGNCDVLEHGEANGHVTDQPKDNRAEFVEKNIDVLIRNPVKKWIGRMNGLNKQISDLVNRLEQQQDNS
jgi:hypothetical protein